MKKFILALGFSLFSLALAASPAYAVGCGTFYSPNPSNSCSCTHSESSSQTGTMCCGWVINKGLPNETCQPTGGTTCGNFYTSDQTANCACVNNGGASGAGQTCCGWVSGTGGSATCAANTVTTCGTGVPTAPQYNNIFCPTSCPGNTTYTENGVEKRCCGTVTNNHCFATTPTTVTCGAAPYSATDNKICNCATGQNPLPDGTLCCGVVNQNNHLCFATEPTSIQCSSTPYSTFDNKACTCASGAQNMGIGNQLCCGWVTTVNGSVSCSATQPAQPAVCGAWWPDPDGTHANTYACPGSCPKVSTGTGNQIKYCCGTTDASGQTNPCTPTSGTNGGNGGTGGTGGTQLTAQTLNNFNSAIFGGSAPDAALTTPRGIISKLLPYLFSLGGLILFIMLIWGGFEMLTGATDPKSQEAGKQRMTAAIIGFLLLFASYWLAQIVQTVFGISIL